MQKKYTTVRAVRRDETSVDTTGTFRLVAPLVMRPDVADGHS